MDHSYYRDRLSAYFDGELPAGEQQEIKLHLGECRECRELLDRMARLDRLVSEHGDLPEDGYWEQSARRIEAQLDRDQDESVTDVREQTTWKSLRWKLAAAAASIAVLTFIAVHRGDILWNESQETPSITVHSPGIPALKPEIPADVSPREMKKREGVGVSSSEIRADDQHDDKLSPQLRAPTVSEPADLVAQPETVAITPAEWVPDLKLTAKPKAAAAPDIPVKENKLLIDHDYIAGVDLPEKAATAHDRDTVELARWRQIRDSLVALTEPRQLPKAARTVAAESREDVDSTEVNISMHLMEAYCHIALLTDDENEYDQATDFLRETATGRTSLSEQAKVCLKQLEGRFE